MLKLSCCTTNTHAILLHQVERFQIFPKISKNMLGNETMFYVLVDTLAEISPTKNWLGSRGHDQNDLEFEFADTNPV